MNLYIKHKCAFLLLGIALFFLYEPFAVMACSSRAIPKPRPSSTSSISGLPPSTTKAPTTTTQPTTTTTTTSRPNITFPTYKCPTNYDAWYCLNEATCFSIKLGDSVLYNCECAVGFMGPRCEYKEIDGSYLPQRPRPILEKASIASGATCALIFVLVICLSLYLRYGERNSKTLALNEVEDYEDGGVHDCCMDEEEEDICIAAMTACRYCNDKRCCGNMGGGSSSLLASEYDALSLRQYVKKLPISFAIKRNSVKL